MREGQKGKIMFDSSHLCALTAEAAASVEPAGEVATVGAVLDLHRERQFFKKLI